MVTLRKVNVSPDTCLLGSGVAARKNNKTQKNGKYSSSWAILDLFFTAEPPNLLSIGSPLRNQLIVGRGTPSERHTKRPFSSGAKTRSAGFSNQNGAAVKYTHVSWFNATVQQERQERTSCLWELLSPLTLTVIVCSMYPILLVALQTYSPASSKDALGIWIILLKFFTLMRGLTTRSSPSLVQLIWGVGLDDDKQGFKQDDFHEIKVRMTQCVAFQNSSINYKFLHTHTPAAMHSKSSSSPCRTSMELDDPVGDSQLGAASATVRAVEETNQNTWVSDMLQAFMTQH